MKYLKLFLLALLYIMFLSLLWAALHYSAPVHIKLLILLLSFIIGSAFGYIAADIYYGE